MLLLEANIPNVVFCHALDYKDQFHNLFVPSCTLYVPVDGRELSTQAFTFFLRDKSTYPFDRERASFIDPE